MKQKILTTMVWGDDVSDPAKNGIASDAITSMLNTDGWVIKQISSTAIHDPKVKEDAIYITILAENGNL